MNELDRALELATAARKKEETDQETAAQKNMNLVADAVHFYIIENAHRGISSAKICEDTPFGYSNKCRKCNKFRVWAGDSDRILRALSKHDTHKTRYQVGLYGGCRDCWSRLEVRLEPRSRCCTQ